MVFLKIIKMKKSLMILVLSLLFSGNAYAKEIYLSCLWEDFYNKEGIKKLIVVEDLIIETKKKKLYKVKYHTYNILNDGSKKDRGPVTFDNFDPGFPVHFHKETKTHYIFGQGILGNSYKSIDEIKKHNKSSKYLNEYTMYSINKFNLQMEYKSYEHPIENNKPVLTRLMETKPFVYQCKELKSKI